VPLIKHSSTTNRTMIKLIMVLVSCVFYAADAFACHHTDEAMFAGQVQTFENQVAVEGLSKMTLRLKVPSLENRRFLPSLNAHTENPVKGSTKSLQHQHSGQPMQDCCEGQCNCTGGMCAHFAIIPSHITFEPMNESIEITESISDYLSAHFSRDLRPPIPS